MDLRDGLSLAFQLLKATLYLPLMSGAVLLLAMALNSLVACFEMHSHDLIGCLNVELLLGIKSPKFWRFILAMWACNLFVVVVAIFFKWREK